MTEGEIRRVESLATLTGDLGLVRAHNYDCDLQNAAKMSFSDFTSGIEELLWTLSVLGSRV